MSVARASGVASLVVVVGCALSRHTRAGVRPSFVVE